MKSRETEVKLLKKELFGNWSGRGQKPNENSKTQTINTSNVRNFHMCFEEIFKLRVGYGFF